MKERQLGFDEIVDTILGEGFETTDPRELPEIYRLEEYFRQGFRNTFKKELERILDEEKRKHYEEMKRIAANTACYSIHLAIIRRVISRKEWQSDPYGFTKPTITEHDGLIQVRIRLLVYTGDHRYGQLRNDARNIQDLLGSLREIEFNSVEGLKLVRDGYPRIQSLRQPVQAPSGKFLPSTHIVETTYATSIPMALLPEIYERHKEPSS